LLALIPGIFLIRRDALDAYVTRLPETLQRTLHGIVRRPRFDKLGAALAATAGLQKQCQESLGIMYNTCRYGQ